MRFYIYPCRAQSTAVQSATMNAIVPPIIAIATCRRALAVAEVAAAPEETAAAVATAMAVMVAAAAR